MILLERLYARRKCPRESCLNHFPGAGWEFSSPAKRFSGPGFGIRLPDFGLWLNQAIDFALGLRVASALSGADFGIFGWVTQGFWGVGAVVAKISQKLELGR